MTTPTVDPAIDDSPWSDEEIAARALDPMPDVPVVAGLAPLVTVLPDTIESLAAPQPGTRAAMIHVARGLVGIHEEPIGSNHAPPITTEYGAGNVPWCDEAVSFEGRHSGNAAAIGHFAYCPAHTRWFANRGEWAYGNGTLDHIEEGDVVFYNWSGRRTLEADHVGLCVKKYGDGTMDVAEGNHNDRFGIVRRDATYVAGRGRPRYPNGAGDAPTPPAPKPPAPKPPTTGKPAFDGRYLRYAFGHQLDHGADVAWVQRLLAHHGHTVAVDGWYGAHTAAAVEAFQRDRGLAVDGIVGPRTWDAL